MSLIFIPRLVVHRGRGPESIWFIDITKSGNKMRVGTVLHYFRFFDDETLNKIASFYLILHLKELCLVSRISLPLKYRVQFNSTTTDIPEWFLIPLSPFMWFD
jgi:hypothetical protein